MESTALFNSAALFFRKYIIILKKVSSIFCFYRINNIKT